jgi:predicted tellurium resistance membrane protein TerC
MILIQFIEFLRQRIKTIVVLSYAVLALLVVIDALPFIVDKHHAHTEIEHIPGFWSAFGFAACVAIAFFSKWCGQAGLMQREDYYND